MNMRMNKNDKAYLKNLKIDIRIDNDIHYQELALLFDKSQFLNLLPDLRRTYNIKRLFGVEKYKEELEKFMVDNFNDGTQSKIDLSKYSKINQFKNYFPNFYIRVTKQNSLPVALDYECYLICYEFGKPPYFFKAIRQAILSGVVTKDNFNSTYATTIDPDTLLFDESLPPVAIFISPFSTYEDVKEEFRRAKETMKTDKRLSYYQRQTDTTTNIRKYRHWYWEHLSGKQYSTIADEWMNNPLAKENDSGADENVVLKGIQTYKRLLES